MPTIGSGSDTIVLSMSEDPDGPAGAAGRDAEFTLNVDGQQIGGLQTVTAERAAGQTQEFTFQGNFAPGPHKVTVTFANNSLTAGDKPSFNDGGDRNVYVNGLIYNGGVVSSSLTPIYASPFIAPLNSGPTEYGNAVFDVTDNTGVPADAPSTPTTTPGPLSFGSGPDTLALAMAEDPYNGDAQFSVSIDGQQIGGALTTTAIQWQGQYQIFTLHGSWGSGAHTVGVTFLNDAIGPVNARGAYDNVDRNVDVFGVAYNGSLISSTPWGLYTTGDQKTYTIPAKTIAANLSAPTMAFTGSSSLIGNDISSLTSHDLAAASPVVGMDIASSGALGLIRPDIQATTPFGVAGMMDQANHSSLFALPV